MGTVGSNIRVVGQRQLQAEFMERFFKRKRNMRRGRAVDHPHIVCQYTAAVPQNNVASGDPGAKGVVIIHYNVAGAYQGIYLCSAYTSSSVYEVMQIMD